MSHLQRVRMDAASTWKELAYSFCYEMIAHHSDMLEGMSLQMTTPNGKGLVVRYDESSSMFNLHSVFDDNSSYNAQELDGYIEIDPSFFQSESAFLDKQKLPLASVRKAIIRADRGEFKASRSHDEPLRQEASVKAEPAPLFKIPTHATDPRPLTIGDFDKAVTIGEVVHEIDGIADEIASLVLGGIEHWTDSEGFHQHQFEKELDSDIKEAVMKALRVLAA